MNRLVELAFPSRTDYLAVARLVVVAAASIEPALGEERLDNLRLAVSEACTNAIEAQQASGATQEEILVRCQIDDERIAVEVLDQGGGFDPDTVPELPEPDRPERLDHESGLGLTLIRLLTDETQIVSSSQGTLIRIIMYREPSAQMAS
ncbi:MAG: ATP-binding protein [Actinomycetota bacterium]|nr:ATP-binding protein [Actinomycetota bacterium]